MAQVIDKIVRSKYPPRDTRVLWFDTTDDSLKSFTSKGWDKVSTKIVENITYSQLKYLRDNGKLIPGCYYRITDYQCTTSKANTKSAGHQFDIIVRADLENKLNEEASAIQHEGDEYFANSDLNTWKIWYCIDNDTARFAWADSTNGKGVIYRMIDEWNNDCPYDFKNIMFAQNWSTIAPDSGLNGTIYCYTFSVFLDGFSDGAIADDESVKAKECIESDDEGDFGNNVIRPSKISGICFLNDIVFITDWSKVGVYHYDNTFGDNCYSNTFGSNCYSNTFGSNCSSNTFGNNCFSSTFGVNCNHNTFSSNCYSNTFGDTCYYNTFGNNSHYNSVGNNCAENTFGNDCNNNTFGNTCSNNTFKSVCHHNTFGAGCHDNTFGANCNHNTFGSDCYNNEFSVLCNSNTFGSGCQGNIFGNDCDNNTFGNDCQYIKFASIVKYASVIKYTRYHYYRNNHFGDGCRYILFKGTETASTAAQVQNYNFSKGLQGTSDAYLTIDGVRNRAYETKVAKNSNGELKIYCEADLVH